MKKLTWFCYATDHVLRKKSGFYKKHKKYCKRNVVSPKEASGLLEEMLKTDKPFATGRLGLFELAAMRMFEFDIKKKYQLVMDNIYNCAGFFPNDIALGDRFTDVMKDAMSQMDIFAANNNILENYFINKCVPKDSSVSSSFGMFDITVLGEESWSKALKGKKVLVVTPFTDSVKQQYAKRELIYKGTEILPEFELITYKSLMTVGDLRDERFATWFDALEFMRKEILEIDFDVALLGCGAYGFPLAAEIKKAGKQAVHMGGVLQILFGIIGKRWDGTRLGGPVHIREDVARYYNENWTYPIEEKPKEAGKVEYGPYWQ